MELKNGNDTEYDAAMEFVKRPSKNGTTESDDCEDDETLCNALSGALSGANLDAKWLTLKDLIDGLHEIFESNRVNIEEVHSLMTSYKSNPAEWLKFAKFDKYRYTRNLVDAGNGKFNLMVLCWGEGHGSSIHDHADSHCFMKMLAGNLCEIRYAWPEEDRQEDGAAPLKEVRRTILSTDQVCYINDSIGLHRVENTSYSEYAVSLHLYCPPYDECSIFDERTGRRMKSKVTFWSLYGERNKDKSIVHPIENN